MPPPPPPQQQLPTLLSLCVSRVRLVRLRVAGSSDDNHDAVLDALEAQLREGFAAVPHASAGESKAIPLAIRCLGRAHVRLCGAAEHEEEEAKEKDDGAWSLPYPHGRVAVVVGLLFCEGEKGERGDPVDVFRKFRADMSRTYPFLDDAGVRCCAFDVASADIERLQGLKAEGLEIVSTAADDATVSVHENLKRALIRIVESLVDRYDESIRECDGALQTMASMVLRRQTSATSSSVSAVQVLSSPPSTPTASIATPTSPTSMPSVKNLETCRLFAGAPSYPGDVAAKPFVAQVMSSASRRALKLLQGRLYVWTGKLFLLAGFPSCALERLEQGIATCHQMDDFVWEAVAHEACAAARELILRDDWNATGVLATPPVTVSDTTFESVDTALQILLKHVSNPAIARLVGEMAVRSAHNRLMFAMRDNLERAKEPLTWARRVHAEHPTISWFTIMEALLWRRFGRDRLESLCVLDAFDTLMLQGDFARAFHVVEDELPINGIVPFTARRQPLPETPRLLDESAWYVSTMFLRRIVRACLMRLDDKDRFVFYAFQLLGKLARRRSIDEIREEIFRLVTEMSQVSTSVDIVDIVCFHPTYPAVDGCEAMGTLRDPSPYFDLFSENAVAPPQLPIPPRKTAFLYSPFEVNSEPHAVGSLPHGTPGNGNNTGQGKRPHKNTTNTSEQQHAVWVVGEQASVQVTLRNIFDIPVSLSLFVRGAGKTPHPVKVMVSGRESKVVTLPIRVDEASLDDETFTLEIRLFGAMFTTTMPAPTRVTHMPLLKRTRNMFANVGTGPAYVILEGNGDTSDQVLVIQPKEEVPETSQHTVVYSNRMERPRLLRKLLPSLPAVLSARVVRCDTEEHCTFGATSVLALSLGAPSAEYAGKELSVGWHAHEHAGRVVAIKSVTIPQNTAAASGSSTFDLRLPIPRDRTFAPDTYRDVSFSCEGQQGSLWECALPPAVTSSAPPDWVEPMTCDISSTKLRVLEFATIATRGGDKSVKDLDSELVAFYKAAENGHGDWKRCDASRVVWVGFTSFPTKENVTASVAFLQPGEYVVGWCMHSPFRMRWWLSRHAVQVDI